jgi:AcrR family transcriptional regulator
VSSSNRRTVTRRRIAEAAAALFSSNGYAETTMQAIADRAGVHVQSVYQVFGSKVKVLAEAAAVLVAGPDVDAAVPPPERRWVREMFAEPDPVRQLALYVHHMREVSDRYLRLVDIMRVTAAADPDVGSFLAQAEEGRYAGPAHLMQELAAKNALRPGLTPARAADMVYALTSYDVFRTLVDERGWSADETEFWLAQTLASLLLA